jgi:hypothetical protein
MRRRLGHRERVRVGAALSFAVNAYEERLQAGNELRQDGFFERQPGGRSAGEEVAEAVVLASQRAFEERKIPYLGHLLANIGFEEQVDGALANRVIRIAEELSWAQLVLLAAVARPDVVVPMVDLGADPGTWIAWGARQDALKLLDDGFLTTRPDKTPKIGLSVPDRRLQDCLLGPAGTLLVELMWLDRIPLDNIHDILQRLAMADG